MALKILQPGCQPFGQFDGLDAEVTLFKGGEVVTLTQVAYKNAVDLGAADIQDGYSGTTSKSRPAVTLTLVSGHRPLFLSDEGTAGYGTLFGSVVGATAGLSVTGTNLGPSTAVASGKVTVWAQPGLYAVTLDACDTTALTGLVPGNASLTCGDPLYATAAGKLTPNSASSFQATTPVGRFVEFATNGSLVTTPNYLTAQGALQSFVQAVFYFNPPV